MKTLVSITTVATALVLLAGCRFLPLTDAEIVSISTTAGEAAGTLAAGATSSLAPGLGASIGVGATAIIALAVRSVLKALQKKDPA